MAKKKPVKGKAAAKPAAKKAPPKKAPPKKKGKKKVPVKITFRALLESDPEGGGIEP